MGIINPFYLIDERSYQKLMIIFQGKSLTQVLQNRRIFEKILLIYFNFDAQPLCFFCVCVFSRLV